MFVDGIQVVPVTDVRERSARHEGQAKCGDYQAFFHGKFLRVPILPDFVDGVQTFQVCVKAK
jgi:hypothetical protein